MKSYSLLKPPKSKILKSSKIILSPGENVGEHITHNKEEIIIVLKGEAILRKNNENIKLESGETCYIGENTVHNVLNNSDKELEYVYVVGLKKEK